MHPKSGRYIAESVFETAITGTDQRTQLHKGNTASRFVVMARATSATAAERCCDSVSLCKIIDQIFAHRFDDASSFMTQDARKATWDRA